MFCLFSILGVASIVSGRLKRLCRFVGFAVTLIIKSKYQTRCCDRNS